MTLNRQIHILAWLAGVTVLAAVLMTAWSALDVKRQTEQILNAESTAKGITNFRFLIMETALYHELRSVRQWEQSVASFRTLLAKTKTSHPREVALLEKQKANLEVLNRLFPKLTVAALEPHAMVANPEANAAVLSALFLTTQDMVDDTFELMHLNRLNLMASEDRASRMLLASLGALILLIVSGFVIIKRRVLQPIFALQAVIGKVAAGELGSRISLNLDNEIGTLAASFDDMTGQLEISHTALQAENTHRRQAQDSLQASNLRLSEKTVELASAREAAAATFNHLRSIVEAASDFSVIATDLAGTITLFSKGAERMLGYSAGEMVGKASPAVIHLEKEVVDRGLAISAQSGRIVHGFDVFVDAVRQGGSESREWTYVRKDGNTLPVNLTVTAVRDPEGNITGFLGIAKDIREENSIRQNLANARDQAESANLAKSQFLANMSHEIRTPMNAILGMLQLLQHTELSPLQQDYAGKSQSAAQSLLGLLNDILDFSKIEAEKMLFEKLPFSIDALLRELSVVLAASVDQKDVDVLFALDPRLPAWLQGDALRVRQVLLNLAGNAIKFTRRGQVVISLQLAASTAHWTEVEFIVDDSGIGISKANLATIFDGFQQAEASTTRRFGGTGLGLSISSRLVALMGSSLSVESQPGQGTTLRFTVRFDNAPDQPPQGQSLPPRPKPDAQRLLIVDDNPRALAVFAEMAVELGAACQGVASGAAALAQVDAGAAAQQPFDAVLIDWRLPDMDCLALAAQLRSRPATAALRIFITTSAYGRHAIAERCREQAGLLDGFLMKPATVTMLNEALHQGGAQALFASTAPPAPASFDLTGFRLLVVDDNLLNQEVARELLTMRGAQVEVADGGKAGTAMALAATPLYDAVLMDIQMPDMDGYEATRLLRRHPAMQALPIIAMTANTMAGDKEACLAAGMNDHIGKPIDLRDLVATIRRHCRSVKTVTAITPPATPMATTPGAITAMAAKDLDLALQRLGGDQRLLAWLAAQFIARTDDVSIVLAQHLAQERASEATRLLHDLKTMAGTVGATRLQDCATGMETSLLHAMPCTEVLGRMDELTALIQQSRLALREVTAQGSGIVDAGTTAALPWREVSLDSLLVELEALLASNNMRAVLVFSELEARFRPMLGAHHAGLEASMGVLAFQEALQKTQALRRERP